MKPDGTGAKVGFAPPTTFGESSDKGSTLAVAKTAIAYYYTANAQAAEYYKTQTSSIVIAPASSLINIK